MPTFDALTPMARWTLAIATIAAWVFGARRIARDTGRLRTAIALTLVLALASWVGSGAMVFRRGRWVEHCRTTAANSQVHVVLERRPFWMDRHIALGRIRSPGIITESIDILREGEFGGGDAGEVHVPEGYDPPRGFSFVPNADGGVTALEFGEGGEWGGLLSHRSRLPRRGGSLRSLRGESDRGTAISGRVLRRLASDRQTRPGPF